jgi:hypothetical protein
MYANSAVAANWLQCATSNGGTPGPMVIGSTVRPPVVRVHFKHSSKPSDCAQNELGPLTPATATFRVRPARVAHGEAFSLPGCNP